MAVQEAAAASVGDNPERQDKPKTESDGARTEVAQALTEPKASREAQTFFTKSREKSSDLPMLAGFEVREATANSDSKVDKLGKVKLDADAASKLSMGGQVMTTASVVGALSIDALSKRDRESAQQLAIHGFLDAQTRQVGEQVLALPEEQFKAVVGKLMRHAAGAAGKADNSALPIAEFAKKAEELFPRIDVDNDGHLSDAELARAMQNDEFQGQEAQVIAALTKMRDDLEELGNDEFGDEDNGITKADLARFAEIEKEHQERVVSTVTAKDWLKTEENFKKVDKDADGFISGDELQTAAAEPNLSEQDKKVLEFLKAKRSEIEEASNDETGDENDGITAKDMETYTDQSLSAVSGAELVGGVAGTLWRTSESQKAEISMDLYANPENPIENIKPDAVKQGTIGNCYLEAAMASVAATDPESIKKMIKDNGDGTYTVTFPGAPDEPITVSAPTSQEMGLYNRGSKEGTWASVLEKAYGQYVNASIWRRGIFNLDGGDTPQEAADGGELGDGTLKLLTGRSTESDSLYVTSNAETARKLQEAFSAKPPRAVTTGIFNHLGSSETADGWPDAHRYSVLGFEPDGKGGGTVIIRNPWDKGDDTRGGTKRISLDEFTRNFSYVTYSQSK